MLKRQAHLFLDVRALPLFHGIDKLLSMPTEFGTKSHWDLHPLLKPHTWKWSGSDKDDNPLTFCVLTWGMQMWSYLAVSWINLPRDTKTRWDTLPHKHWQSYARHLYFCLLSSHTPLLFGGIPRLVALSFLFPGTQPGPTDAPDPVFESLGSDRLPRYGEILLTAVVTASSIHVSTSSHAAVPS